MALSGRMSPNCGGTRDSKWKYESQMWEYEGRRPEVTKWKDESKCGEDEVRRPEVMLSGRMSTNGGKTRAEGPK